MLKELFTQIAGKIGFEFIYDYLGEADDLLNHLNLAKPVLILNKRVSITSVLDEYSLTVDRESATLELHLLTNNEGQEVDYLRATAARIVQLAANSNLATTLQGSDRKAIDQFTTSVGFHTSTDATTLQVNFVFTYNPKVKSCEVVSCPPLTINYDC
jgi:hypothetical protein